MELHIYESVPGEYQMDYYYNGELERNYHLLGGNSGIYATTADGETYMVETIDQGIIAQEGVPTVTPYASSIWQTLGNFQYKPVTGIAVPVITVSTQIYDSRLTQKTVISPKNALVADVAAQITEGIISAVLGVIVSPTGLAAAVTASLLSGMIAAQGGEIVNQAITVALSDKYDIVTNYHYLRAHAPSVNSIKDYQFTSAYVSYNGQPFEYYGYSSGFTRDNWSTSEFGQQAWNDTFGSKGYSFPGILRVIFEDPA